MTKKRKQLYVYFSIYFVVIISFAVLPPLVAQWNKIEPHILGLPFSQFTVILFAILLIAGLLGWFTLEGKLNNEEKAKRQRGEKLEY